jgi:hypothetical protein
MISKSGVMTRLGRKCKFCNKPIPTSRDLSCLYCSSKCQLNNAKQGEKNEKES